MLKIVFLAAILAVVLLAVNAEKPKQPKELDDKVVVVKVKDALKKKEVQLPKGIMKDLKELRNGFVKEKLRKKSERKDWKLTKKDFRRKRLDLLRKLKRDKQALHKLMKKNRKMNKQRIIKFLNDREHHKRHHKKDMKMKKRGHGHHKRHEKAQENEH